MCTVKCSIKEIEKDTHTEWKENISKNSKYVFSVGNIITYLDPNSFVQPQYTG